MHSSKTNKIENIRHSLAHLLAAVVQKRYPKVKLGIGPAIEGGFYYDFLFAKPISADVLPEIEKDMRELIRKGLVFSGEKITPAKARTLFKNQTFKLELIKDFSKEKKQLTTYKTGDVFQDLCKGGHVKNTSEINPDAFKLTHLAGAYWKGDEKNKMLTRIYGAAFETKRELDEYLAHIAEAEKRDHRRIGKELDLFTFSDLIGAGLPLFTPRGAAMREALIDFLWSLSKKYGYQKVSIPHITKIDLYEKSGHAAKFKDEFFYVHGAQSGADFVMKPMNCPHHTQIYASRPRSYRDLPIRLNEPTMMYRDEKPGQLRGIERVRSITVDDAHIFCTPDQIKDEAKNIVKIIKEFYSALGMWKEGVTFWVSLSVRDPKNLKKYLGEDKNWNKAENFLEEVALGMDLNAKRMEGEAAFYGPKLDFMFKDALGRETQLATIQIDFVQPDRLGLEYVSENGKKEIPVMIHRAIAGSLERFMSILIEHFAGVFPLWLSPVQIVVIPISEKFNKYAEEVREKLFNADIRVEVDDSNETLGKRIRSAEMQKAPYIAIVGEKEMNAGTIALRKRGKGDEGVIGVDKFIERLEKEIEEKTL
ncbi:MAG: threonine--tRNA ligase [Candidatus Colwellbacteria bacterium]|nr:threonine--tRNA ligase [Candidatus Colwellbacteria bacterium]